MKLLSVKNLLLTSGILISLFLPAFFPNQVGAVMPILTEIETTSINRTWDDVALLYPNQFLNTSMVAEEVENAHSAVPQLVDVAVIGQSYEKRDILSIRIINEASSRQKAKTLVVAHHHGREKVTVNQALYFIQWLVNSYGTDPQITEYIDTEEIYVIPTLNPDALDYIYNTSNHWLRKNLRPYDDDGDGLFDEDTYDDANGDGYVTQFEVWKKESNNELTFLYAYYEGVDDDNDGRINEDWVGHTDLNRNYDTNWGIEPTASLDSTSQAFAGTAPFSEPETQVFRDFAQQHRFGVAYSLHTGINATFFVTDTAGNWIEPSLYTQMWDDYRVILPEGFNDYAGYSVKRISKVWPAILSGGWDEYMYHELGCIAPVTFEVYHNATAESSELYYIYTENSTHRIMAFNGIYEYFSPDAKHIENLWLELVPAYKYLLEQTPRVSVAFHDATLQGKIISATMVTRSLSPRIKTIDAITIRLTDGTMLESTSSVDASSTTVSRVGLDIASLEQNGNLTIKVGNEFTGYLWFLVTFIEGTPISPFLIIITISIAAIVVVIAYLLRRR